MRGSGNGERALSRVEVHFSLRLSCFLGGGGYRSRGGLCFAVVVFLTPHFYFFFMVGAKMLVKGIAVGAWQANIYYRYFVSPPLINWSTGLTVRGCRRIRVGKPCVGPRPVHPYLIPRLVPVWGMVMLLLLLGWMLIWSGVAKVINKIWFVLFVMRVYRREREGGNIQKYLYASFLYLVVTWLERVNIWRQRVWTVGVSQYDSKGRCARDIAA